MKNLTLIGVILLALSFLLYSFIPEFSIVRLFEPTSLMGILAGVGIGLIIGGMVGYVSKGSAIKEEQKRKELKQLQKEKVKLEKQAEELTKEKERLEQINSSPSNSGNSTQL